MNMDPASLRRLGAHLVVGGVSHDMDYVRLELLRLLAEHPQVRVTVAPTFEDPGLLEASAFLVSYTCDVRPSEGAERRLAQFVENGGRWLALHATNSFLDWTEEGVASAHRRSAFFETLGSAFVAHPPMTRFRVQATRPEHPIVAGLTPFDVEDELYLCEFFGNPDVLLETEFVGEAPGFVASDWAAPAKRPVMYLNRRGAGEVLYLTLGHARGHWDAPHRTPYYPRVERGAWAQATFRELLRRAIRWAAHLDADNV